MSINEIPLFFRYISVYVTWMYLVFMYIVPFTSLAVLNLLIFLEIRKVGFTGKFSLLQSSEEYFEFLLW